MRISIILALATLRSVWAFSATVTLPSSSSSSSAPPTLGDDCSSYDVATERLETLLDDFPRTERYCYVGVTKFGRGLVATEDLQPGQLALRIPLECAIVEWDPDRNEDRWTGRLANRLMESFLLSSTSVDKLENSLMVAYTQSLPEPPSTPARGDWPEEILQEFDHQEFVDQIRAVRDWRYHQWKSHCGTYAEHRQSFLDALDLTCSRTIRLGDSVMLVPLLDMANHASEEEGGGYFERQEDSICLRVGERGVPKGQEVTMDYGSRSNEDWLLHYGFLPCRNGVESVTLPDSNMVVTWKDARTSNVFLQKESRAYLEEAATSLEADLELLRSGDINDFRLETAVQYRVNRKSLLSAVSGQFQFSTFSSTFAQAVETDR